MQVIKSKKETFLANRAKGIISPTLEELTKEVPEDDNSEGSSNTVSDNVFKGLRDDLDFIDENDVGKLKRKQYKEFDSR